MTNSLVTSTPVELTAASAEGGRPTFEIVAYTGAPMKASYNGKPTDIVVDMQGVTSRSQDIVALFNHDQNVIVGQGTMSVEGGKVVVRGIITGENAQAADIVAHAKNGFKWQASIGANPQNLEALAAGKTAIVNGQTVTGPVLIARKTPIHEVSFVPFGADPGTSATLAAASAPHTNGGSHMNPFETWLSEKGFDPATLTESQKATLQAAFNSDKASQPRTLDAILADAERENERQNKIASLTASMLSQYPGQVSLIKEFAEAAITAKMSPVDFELQLHRNLKVPGSAINTRHNAPKQLDGEVLEAALCIAGRLPNIEKRFNEATLEAAEKQFRHGIGLQELLLAHARRNDASVTSARDVRGVLQAAFQSSLTASGGFSTLPLPGILSNVANKFLLQGFMAVESAWRAISAIRSVSDFKTATSYRLTGGFEYLKVGASGELKHATVGEESYTNRAETYGRMFAITRQDIINDDLGALTSVPMRLGRGASIKLNTVFWTEFLADVTTFYTTGRGNYFEGAATGLQSSSLKTAVEKFRKQTDSDGNPLALQPKFLLVGPENEVAADELFTSTNINTGGAASTEKVPNRNVFAGKYQPVVTSYLSNSNITNYSTTHWFLVADPADLPVIEVAFLNGREAPIVESADADFNVLGIQMRGYHDFGVSKQDYRAAVRSKGAA